MSRQNHHVHLFTLPIIILLFIFEFFAVTPKVLAGGLMDDCNSNGVEDIIDVVLGTSEDCDSDFVPDECELDCDSDGTPDDCEAQDDCNSNSIPDDCELAGNDCNTNGILDECDVRDGILTAGVQMLAVSQDVGSGLFSVNTSNAAISLIGLLNQSGSSETNTQRAYGLASHPATGELFAITQTSSTITNVTIKLSKIDPDTGITQLIGTIGTRASANTHIVDLSFDDDGTLFGVTGFRNRLGLTVPGRILTLNQTTGAPSNVILTSDTGNGQSIAMQNDTRFMFHMSGNNLERINLNDQNIDSISTNLPDFNSFLAFQPVDGLLFGGRSILRSINPGNSQVITIGDMSITMGDADFIADFILPEDCNSNLIPDDCEPDSDGNGIPDECDAPPGDCNDNGIPDGEEILAGSSLDCNSNLIPDECELLQNDCNSNLVPDECDLIAPTGGDCNANQLPDDCDIAQGSSDDCNSDGVPDECQLTDNDANGDGVPDDCQLPGNDCNSNNVPDDADITGPTSLDCNEDGTPDECQLVDNDANNNQIPDDCESLLRDCNNNGVIDFLDIQDGTSEDCNSNIIPDECESSSTLLFAVARESSNLLIADPAVGVLSTVGNLSPDQDMALGLATHPQTDELFAITMTSTIGTQNRLLSIIDTRTAATQVIGLIGTGNSFSTHISEITFESNATLMGVTGGHNRLSPSSSGRLVVIDSINANSALLGINADTGRGQSIAFQPSSELLFHSFGSSIETINLLDGLTNPVGAFNRVFRSLTFHPLTEDFLGATDSNFADININQGTLFILGEIDNSISGISFPLVVRDCNSNSVFDECEPDSDNDGIIDDCDLCAGFDDRVDCNDNDIPDGCDLLSGSSEDCNSDGIPDECVSIGPVVLESPPILVISGIRPFGFTFNNPPPANSLVQFTFTARADDGESNEFIDSNLNGEDFPGSAIGILFENDANNCPQTPDQNHRLHEPRSIQPRHQQRNRHYQYRSHRHGLLFRMRHIVHDHYASSTKPTATATPIKSPTTANPMTTATASPTIATDAKGSMTATTATATTSATSATSWASPATTATTIIFPMSANWPVSSPCSPINNRNSLLASPRPFRFPRPHRPLRMFP